MTKQEAMHRVNMNNALMSLGFSSDECDQLRRISLTLSHWAERECNEDIETRDDGSAWLTPRSWRTAEVLGKAYRIPNREAGALRRLGGIMASRKRTVTYYHQTDPRGAALYIVPLSRLRDYLKRTQLDTRLGRDGKRASMWTVLDSCYSSVGIAVY
jgi:hypothetical protein